MSDPRFHKSVIYLISHKNEGAMGIVINQPIVDAKLENIINAQCRATKNIFKLKKIPYRQITFNKRNENELGMIFTFFVLETILLSRLMHINPFDQPAVEEVKIVTKKFLK